MARPETILGWYRKLDARKFDGSKARRGPGRPRVSREIEELIVRMASENRSHLAEFERCVFEALHQFMDTRRCVTLNFRWLGSAARLVGKP